MIPFNTISILIFSISFFIGSTVGYLYYYLHKDRSSQDKNRLDIHKIVNNIKQYLSEDAKAEDVSDAIESSIKKQSQNIDISRTDDLRFAAEKTYEALQPDSDIDYDEFLESDIANYSDDTHQISDRQLDVFSEKERQKIKQLDDESVDILLQMESSRAKVLLNSDIELNPEELEYYSDLGDTSDNNKNANT